MGKPWQTSEWRKKRREFLKDGTCEWCGSTENLAIHHKNHFNALKEYKKILTKQMREYFENGKNREEKQELMAKALEKVNLTYSYLCPNCGNSVYARKTISPKYKCKKCGEETDEPQKKQTAYSRSGIRREFQKMFLERHKDEVDKIYHQLKEKSDRDYMDFKNVEILCRKCHFAKEKGLVLCAICGENYHKPKYEKCWNCFTKTTEGKRIAQKNREIPYTHPWCNKIFNIKAEWWDIEANPQMCCIEHCEDDCNNCDVALKNWGA